MITDQDIEKLKQVFATKEDLNKFATKDDINRLKADLKHFTTKDDLKQFVTNKDFTFGLNEILECIANVKEDLLREIALLRVDIVTIRKDVSILSAYREMTETHEVRIAVLEKHIVPKSD